MFLNVLEIKKLAYRKGCAAEPTTTVSGKNYVRLTDPRGRAIDCAKRNIGFSLIEAKRPPAVIVGDLVSSGFPANLQGLAGRNF